MEIVLKADRNVCEINGWQSNTGEVNTRELNVELSEEMLNCDMSFVTFELNDGTVYESKVTDGKADIPEIRVPQFIKIGAYSSDVEGDKCVKRYSPHPVDVYVNNGSYSGNSTEPPIPTAGDFERLLGELDNKLGADDVIAEFNKNATFEDNDVYSANAVNKEFNRQSAYIDKKLAEIDAKEDVGNKVTEVDEDSTDDKYASAKAVYDFGTRILAIHQEQVDAQMNELEERLTAYIGGIENGSY